MSTKFSKDKQGKQSLFFWYRRWATLLNQGSVGCSPCWAMGPRFDKKGPKMGPAHTVCTFCQCSAASDSFLRLGLPGPAKIRGPGKQACSLRDVSVGWGLGPGP